MPSNFSFLNSTLLSRAVDGNSAQIDANRKVKHRTNLDGEGSKFERIRKNISDNKSDQNRDIELISKQDTRNLSQYNDENALSQEYTDLSGSNFVDRESSFQELNSEVQHFIDPKAVYKSSLEVEGDLELQVGAELESLDVTANIYGKEGALANRLKTLDYYKEDSRLSFVGKKRLQTIC